MSDAACPSPGDRTEPAELTTLRELLRMGAPHVREYRLGTVAADGAVFPLLAAVMGSDDPNAPAVGFFGGVHGLERIGSEVVLAYLGSLIRRLRWDEVLRHQLRLVRLVFFPVVNPGGVWRWTRANPSGVDLMRNAPVDAEDLVPFLVGGQRLSSGLPWYRGKAGAPMQPEAQALCDLAQRELLSHRFSLALDCHSGFGVTDRIWFPHAHTPRPIEHVPELHALKDVLDEALPNHAYVFEPQSRHYLAHGDLWDYLYLGACARPGAGLFLPLTLEMGSWLWVKKNPRQLFNRHGLFNPLIRHRQQRVLRRHLAWMDLLVRAAIGHAHWLPRGDEREERRQQALTQWYHRALP